MSYDISGSDVQYVSGAAHSSIVTGLASAGGNTLSVGFDDTLKEVGADAKSMTCVLPLPVHSFPYISSRAYFVFA